MKNSEACFNVQAAKFNAIATTTDLSECSTALMLRSSPSSTMLNDYRLRMLQLHLLPKWTHSRQRTRALGLWPTTMWHLWSSRATSDVSPALTKQTTLYPQALVAFRISRRKTAKNGNCDSSGILVTMEYPCNTGEKFGYWMRNHRAYGFLSPSVKSFGQTQDSNNPRR